jgi:hypothetical protein
MFNLHDPGTSEWLHQLSRNGRVVSVETIYPIAKSQDISNFRGFAIINAWDTIELNTLLQGCPDLDLALLEIYKLA